jgi:hypothetical protein
MYISSLRALDHAIKRIVSNLVFDGLTRGTLCLDAIYMVHFVNGLDDVFMALGYHGM